MRDHPPTGFSGSGRIRLDDSHGPQACLRGKGNVPVSADRSLVSEKPLKSYLPCLTVGAVPEEDGRIMARLSSIVKRGFLARFADLGRMGQARLRCFVTGAGRSCQKPLMEYTPDYALDPAR